jgi:hypothetical protein
MPRALPALFPACITTVTHGPAAGAGSANFWQHLITAMQMTRGQRCRGAPFRGEAPARLAFSKGKSSIARKFPMSFLIRSMQRQNALLREFS